MREFIVAAACRSAGMVAVNYDHLKVGMNTRSFALLHMQSQLHA